MQRIKSHAPRIDCGNLIDRSAHGLAQFKHSRRDYELTYASHHSHYRDRNHFSQPRQPAAIAIDEESSDEEKQRNLKSAAVDDPKEPSHDRARQFIRVSQPRAAQHAEKRRRNCRAEKNRSAEPKPEQ